MRCGTSGAWNRRLVCAGFAGILALGSLPVVAEEQPAKDGVYSAEQATRGESLYDQQCKECHGGDLRGFEYGPALAGSEFLRVWGKKSLADLMEKIQTEMPGNAPGSLDRSQVADVMAYMLRVGKFPAGSGALGTDAAALKAITIGK